MRSLLLFALALTLALPLTATPARSEKPIVVFGNGTKPPKNWVEDDEPRGILVDILRQVEKRTGLRFDIRLMPWKRAYMHALDNQGGIMGLSLNRERATLFDFTRVMYYDEMRLVVIKGNEFDYRSVQDLRGLTVGVTRGASYGDVFEEAKNSVFTLSEDANPVSRLRMLLARRIDVALMGPGTASVRHVISQDAYLRANRDQFVILDTPFTRDANYLGFSKELCRTNTLEVINEALDTMWEDGTIEDIEARY